VVVVVVNDGYIVQCFTFYRVLTGSFVPLLLATAAAAACCPLPSNEPRAGWCSGTSLNRASVLAKAESSSAKHS
jgi:hypothetical protein